MKNKSKKYDLVIIGGGAAGMSAAISCRRNHPKHSIAIIDRTFALGRKILVCGGGRCNLTNKHLKSNLKTHYHGSEYTFLESVFTQFPYEEIVSFFEELGVELQEDRRSKSGKIFPITNQGKTITSLLIDELERNQITILLNNECANIEYKNESFHIMTRNTASEGSPIKNNEIGAKKLILSAGSKTYPALGSNGSGYDLASSLGHSIIQPIPSALPLEGKNVLSQKLQGIKITAEVTSYIEGKECRRSADDLLFTKYGLSGSAILNISREISIHLNREKKKNCFVAINFMPGKSVGQVTRLLHQRWDRRPDQSVEKSLFGILPNKVSGILLASIKVEKNKPVEVLSKLEKRNIVEALSNTKIQISATRGWNEAEFTVGGVNTTEVKRGTLESKKQPGLYFCGEILDVDGEIGGYNLSWCWSSGWVAGKLL